MPYTCTALRAIMRVLRLIGLGQKHGCHLAHITVKVQVFDAHLRLYPSVTLKIGLQMTWT